MTQWFYLWLIFHTESQNKHWDHPCCAHYCTLSLMFRTNIWWIYKYIKHKSSNSQKFLSQVMECMNPSAWEAKVRQSWVQRQTGLYSRILTKNGLFNLLDSLLPLLSQLLWSLVITFDFYPGTPWSLLRQYNQKQYLVWLLILDKPEVKLSLSVVKTVQSEFLT